MTRRTLAASLFAFAVAGCTGSGSDPLKQAPADWATYAGDTVTVRGTAGNMPTGPIVRLPYGGYVGINTTQPWSIQYVTRPVEVKGKIVSGAGIRTEPYVLAPESVKIVEAETPAGEAEPAPDAKWSGNGR